MSADRKRLTLAVLLSLLVHAPLLSLTFGGQSFGLPGFTFPWQERRTETPALQVVLASAQTIAAVPTQPSGASAQGLPQQAIMEPTVAHGPTLKPSLALSKIPALASAQTVEVISPHPARTEPVAPATEARIAPDIATVAIAAIAPAPAVIAVERPDAPTFIVPPRLPAAAPAPAPIIAVAPITAIASDPETAVSSPRGDATKLETAPQDAAHIEAARLEAARMEAARQESVRLAAAKLEAQRQTDKLAAARMETARVEAAKLEAARQEAALLAAAKLEAQRQADKLAAARVEAVTLEATRIEAARLEAARRQESARQESIQQAAAQKEAAQVLAGKEEDEKRAARRQAMGRVLDEEAARRKAIEATEATAAAARAPPTLPSTLPYSLSTARRGRLLGRTDANAELVLYAEAWARKMQFNTSADTVRDVAKRPHTNPMVTVAIRSDGSVESVTFVVSSGVAEVDEAIRRIVQSHMPYQRFPPGLAREFDVIEVRRTWHFDTAIRLY